MVMENKLMQLLMILEIRVKSLTTPPRKTQNQSIQKSTEECQSNQFNNSKLTKTWSNNQLLIDHYMIVKVIFIRWIQLIWMLFRGVRKRWLRLIGRLVLLEVVVFWRRIWTKIIQDSSIQTKWLNQEWFTCNKQFKMKKHVKD